MKTVSSILTLLFCLVLTSISYAAGPILLPAWQTDSVFEQPESVVLDKKRNILYVSNVNGNPNDVDGNGYISQLGLDGKIIAQHWIDGFNGPKGMAIVGDVLYVADINELVAIDLASNKISQRYVAKDAKFLNDVAADQAGNVYVSDMLTNTIYRLSNNTFGSWINDQQLEFPNGLLVEGDNLILGSWGVMTDGFATTIPGHLKTISIATKAISSLGDGTAVGNLDGVESDGEGNYFVTDWMVGKLLHITPAGISTTLLSLTQGSADHTVLADQNLVIIPMMLSGNVIAYEIKK
ncbi:MAG: SMP-30/gluconolactonase/LRE family protein [Gammaproteobacteria bacterium]|nr:SMP-30/gluconolactonase/LRE family protein [Gammaproteobacteria bacterium]